MVVSYNLRTHVSLFKSRYFIIIYFPFLLYLMLKPRIIRLVTFISEHMMLEKAGLSIIFLYFVFMLMYYQILEYTWRWNFTSFILFNESFISKCFKRDIIYTCNCCSGGQHGTLAFCVYFWMLFVEVWNHFPECNVNVLFRLFITLDTWISCIPLFLFLFGRRQ